jgi:hypothetical protein
VPWITVNWSGRLQTSGSKDKEIQNGVSREARRPAKHWALGASIMDILYFPIIAEGDYEAFRNIMHSELPPAYDEWLKRHADRVAFYNQTHRIIDVKVNADDFSAFIREHGRGADLKALYNFTAFIGQRSKD